MHMHYRSPVIPMYKDECETEGGGMVVWKLANLRNRTMATVETVVICITDIVICARNDIC